MAVRPKLLLVLLLLWDLLWLLLWVLYCGRCDFSCYCAIVGLLHLPLVVVLLRLLVLLVLLLLLPGIWVLLLLWFWCSSSDGMYLRQSPY